MIERIIAYFFSPVVNTRVLSLSELSRWKSRLPRKTTVTIVFGGNRFDCVDDAVGVERNGKIVAVATLASRGELMNGEPAIVAVYTLKRYRRKGYGRMAIQAAIARAKELGISKLRYDLLSSVEAQIVASLKPEERAMLDVHTESQGMDMLLLD